MSVVGAPAAGQTNPIPTGAYVKEIISTTQFRLGNANDTEEIEALATIGLGIGGGVTLNFELSQGKLYWVW